MPYFCLSGVTFLTRTSIELSINYKKVYTILKEPIAMSDNIEEKRKSPRLPLDVQVNFQEKGFAKSKDISSGGICLITEEALEEKKIYKLAFSFPGETDQLECFGKVMWTRQATKHMSESGLSFWDIGKNLQKKIDTYFVSA